jgi:hypothetical protein
MLHFLRAEIVRESLQDVSAGFVLRFEDPLIRPNASLGVVDEPPLTPLF